MFLSTLFLYVPFPIMAAEEPEYKIIEKSGDYELRRYQPVLIAEVLVDGNMNEASGKGFRLIADYIFGNNTTKTGNSRKIKMTSPVTVEPESNEISMTAPVTLKKVTGKWRVNFIMPGKYTFETIPAPKNKRVILREVPAREVAVVRFSGIADEESTAEKTQNLLKWMDNKNLTPAGSIELARYDPPWTLPFLRRNEIVSEYTN